MKLPPNDTLQRSALRAIAERAVRRTRGACGAHDGLDTPVRPAATRVDPFFISKYRAKMAWSRGVSSKSFYMLLIYTKAVQDDMTPSQLRVLRRLVQEEFS